MSKGREPLENHDPGSSAHTKEVAMKRSLLLGGTVLGGMLGDVEAEVMEVLSPLTITTEQSVHFN